MKSIVVSAALVSLALTGCASITRGVKEDVKIEVTPANANIQTTTGHTCKGSCTIKIPRKEAFSITASAPGYQTEVIDVKTRVSRRGVVGVAGNAIIGGVIGVAIDTANGASLNHDPNPVILQLERGSGSKKVFPEPSKKPEGETVESIPVS